MVIAEVSIIPLGTGSSSVSEYVAGAITVLAQQKDVKYQLTPMGTIIEGDLVRVLDAITKMHESAFVANVKRVVTRITIDDRRDKAASMESKVKAVNEKLTTG